MQSISFTFTVAARAKARAACLDIFWMMVWAISILDDGEDREKVRRCSHERAKAAIPKPPTPR